MGLPPSARRQPVRTSGQGGVRRRGGGRLDPFAAGSRYLDAIVSRRRAHAVAWSYAAPTAGYEELRDYIAFYPGRVDAAWLDDERVQAQPGDFYGGWITSDLVGPFKGLPGTRGW